MEKAYKVGISTGFWYIAKDPALLGLAAKIGGFGATGGVQFVQIDLETVAEFYEPDVAKQVKRIKDKLGMVVGLHGEISENMSVDCAEKRIWDQTHTRLVQAIKYAAEMGFIYVVIHFSVRPILSLSGEAQQRAQGIFYPVVDPYGRGLQELVRGAAGSEKEALRHIEPRYLQNSPTFQAELEKYIDEKVKELLPAEIDAEMTKQLRYYPNISEEEKKELRKRLEKEIDRDLRSNIYRSVYNGNDSKFNLRAWLKTGKNEYERYLLADGEYGAFQIVAHWMKEKGDYLWSNIAKGANPDDLYYKDEQVFCAAVASKYLEGHVTVKDNDANRKYLNGMSIKEWCEAKKLYMLFENPEANRGHENAYRLFHPQHYYHTIKNINSPYVRICVDMEHMVSHALDPDVEFPKLPGDFGKYVVLWHLGQAVPYGGVAHIPIPRGSVAQEQIYKWMYWIRKKGWKEGYLLFERGGGRTGSGRSTYEVFEDSVLALKQIADYLEKDVDPKQLPPEFFGISTNNKEVWARQVVTIKEHAWDPLEGVLSIPEEKHTFLGSVAVGKGKAQEWEKRKFR